MKNPTAKELQILHTKLEDYIKWFRLTYGESKIQLESLVIVEQAIKYDLIRAKEWESYYL